MKAFDVILPKSTTGGNLNSPHPELVDLFYIADNYCIIQKHVINLQKASGSTKVLYPLL